MDTLTTDSLSLVVLSKDGLLISEMVSCAEDVYVLDVPHDVLSVNVWRGDKDLAIPYGCECPAVYMHSFEADARGETFYQQIQLRKNHCMLTVRVEGYEKVPYSFTLYGNVDGYELNGVPSVGGFSCVAYPAENGGSHVILPRQRDDSLMLEVDDGTATSKVFALGEYLAAGGYDWTAADLKDVTVVLDYYVTYVKIHVQGWEEEHIYDVIL